MSTKDADMMNSSPKPVVKISTGNKHAIIMIPVAEEPLD